MKSYLQRFRDGFSKSSRSLLEGAADLFAAGKIDQAAMDQLEEALYAADFGPATAQEVLDEIKEAVSRDRHLRARGAAEVGAAVLKRVLQGSEAHLVPAIDKPTVVCLIGVNGSGKTTTAAKLAYRQKNIGHEVLLAAADTFRAAAIEQLQTWAQRLDLDIVAGQRGSDSAAVAFDSWQAAKARGHDLLIIDTAGRLHTKSNLMEELSKIRRVLQKNDAAAPHYSLLVVDGSIGSNSLEQARIFHQSFGLDGLVVTKLDGTSRGGALVSIYRELKLPIFFVGLGEQPDDLQPFSVEAYANAIFGLQN
jgi:fused signal recognition particle receptor